MSLPGVSVERSGARRVVSWRDTNGASLRVVLDVRKSTHGHVMTTFWGASVNDRPVDPHEPLAEYLFDDASRILRATGEDRP